MTLSLKIWFSTARSFLFVSFVFFFAWFYFLACTTCTNFAALAFFTAASVALSVVTIQDLVSALFDITEPHQLQKNTSLQCYGGIKWPFIIAKNWTLTCLQIKKLELWFFANMPGSYDPLDYDRLQYQTQYSFAYTTFDGVHRRLLCNALPLPLKSTAIIEDVEKQYDIRSSVLCIAQLQKQFVHSFLSQLTMQPGTEKTRGLWAAAFGETTAMLGSFERL